MIMRTIKNSTYILLIVLFCFEGCQIVRKKGNYPIIDSNDIFITYPYEEKKSNLTCNIIQDLKTRIITLDGYNLEKSFSYGGRFGKYKNGIPMGEWITKSAGICDKDGSFKVDSVLRIVRVEHFKDGLQDGDYKIYDRKGNIIYQTKFTKGNGLEKDYHANGQLYYEIYKENGYFTDTLKLYDTLGRLTDVLLYKGDSLVFHNKYDFSRPKLKREPPLPPVPPGYKIIYLESGEYKVIKETNDK